MSNTSDYHTVKQTDRVIVWQFCYHEDIDFTLFALCKFLSHLMYLYSLSPFLIVLQQRCRFWCKFPLYLYVIITRNPDYQHQMKTGTSDKSPNLWLIASKRCLARISWFEFGDVRSVFLEDRGLDPGICCWNIKWDCPCLRYATQRWLSESWLS